MSETDPRCMTCGHKRSNHPYRHMFVGPSFQQTIEELEAKLERAVKAFEEIKRYSPCGDSRRKAIDTLAELKGQNDE